MIDIASHFHALKSVWVHHILNSGQANWAFLFRHYINKFGGDNLILKTKFKQEESLHALKYFQHSIDKK